MPKSQLLIICLYKRLGSGVKSTAKSEKHLDAAMSAAMASASGRSEPEAADLQADCSPREFSASSQKHCGMKMGKVGLHDIYNCSVFFASVLLATFNSTNCAIISSKA